jgi:hypothetical protein
MDSSAANLILLLAGIYTGAGLLVGVWLVAFGLGRLDPAARGAGVGVRLIILPGVVALWPLMLRRALRASSGSHARSEP